jgi:bla regulator protein blaR1
MNGIESLSAWRLLGDHLWQSTILVGIIFLLTLTLSRNRARVRYWLWVIASAKFLVPFSLLIAFGGHLSSTPKSASVQASTIVFVEQASRPFTQSLGSPDPVAKRIPSIPRSLHLIPFLILATWGFGSVIVSFKWWRQWRRVLIAVRDASFLEEGREEEELRRMELLVGVRGSIPMRLSYGNLEPGVFGIRRPILLWPAGLSDYLDSGQLRAVLAHELWHVRHHDNLIAAIQMIVEAIFWFHPFVWWISNRLIDERERACDEAIMLSGVNAQEYAEGILSVCNFFAASPSTCMSGVTGGNLQNRITRIMMEVPVNRVSFGRKLLMTTVGVVMIAGPVAFGIASVPKIRAQKLEPADDSLPLFDHVSITRNHSGGETHSLQRKSNGLMMTNVSIREVVEFAYGLKSFELSGGPTWIDSERYDVDATMETYGRTIRDEQYSLMMKSVLADRFHLKLSHHRSHAPIYTLVNADSGFKLFPSAAQSPLDTGNKASRVPRATAGTFRLLLKDGRSQLIITASSVRTLAGFLSQTLAREVVDQTGLTGHYDFTLQWTTGSEGSDVPSGPSLFTALQEQLGLKLEDHDSPIESFSVEKIEKPS